MQQDNPNPPNRKNAATTFRADEIALLYQLCSLLMRGGDPTILVRHPSFATAFGKIQRMQQKLSGTNTV